jgi:hypothetical protein
MRDVRLRRDAQSHIFKVRIREWSSPTFFVHVCCIEHMLCIASNIRTQGQMKGFAVEYGQLTCYDSCVLDSDRHVVA